MFVIIYLPQGVYLNPKKNVRIKLYELRTHFQKFNKYFQKAKHDFFYINCMFVLWSIRKCLKNIKREGSYK